MVDEINGDARVEELKDEFWCVVLNFESTLVSVALDVENTLVPVKTSVKSSLVEHVESLACNWVVTGMITNDRPTLNHWDEPFDVRSFVQAQKN